MKRHKVHFWEFSSGESSRRFEVYYCYFGGGGSEVGLELDYKTLVDRAYSCDISELGSPDLVVELDGYTGLGRCCVCGDSGYGWYYRVCVSDLRGSSFWISLCSRHYYYVDDIFMIVDIGRSVRGIMNKLMGIYRFISAFPVDELV